MTDKPDKQNEVKYDPEYFINDLEGILGMLMEKVEMMGEIEFSLRQRSQIAGLILGVATTFGKINDKLKEWGFIA